VAIWQRRLDTQAIAGNKVASADARQLQTC